MTNPIVRKIRNFIGKLKGYGSCYICGDTWNWKEEHTIYFTEGRGAFPTCEECWQTKSNKEIIDAVGQLCSNWIAQSPAHYYHDKCLLKIAAKKELSRREEKASC